jgi:hypothetical protein
MLHPARAAGPMVGVAQLVRAPGCGPGCRGFESPRSPHGNCRSGGPARAAAGPSGVQVSSFGSGLGADVVRVLPELVQERVQDPDWRPRGNARPLIERSLPKCLQTSREDFPHSRCDVAVDAAHTRHFVAHALRLQDVTNTQMVQAMFDARVAGRAVLGQHEAEARRQSASSQRAPGLNRGTGRHQPCG